MNLGEIQSYYTGYVNLIIKQRDDYLSELNELEKRYQKLKDDYDELEHNYPFHTPSDDYDMGKCEGYKEGFASGKQVLKDNICDFLEIRQADDVDNYD